MRVFPLATRALAVGVFLTVASTPSAQADDPTDDRSVGALQVQLVQSRMHLNDLYARSAAAAERLNGATFELAEVEADLKRQRAAVKRAEGQLADQRDTVATLTVEQLQSGSGTSRLTTLFESEGPQQLLERAGAYASTNEAMNARVDTLTARQVVRDAAVRRADDAQDARRAAVEKQATAAAGIDDAIAAAEAAVDSTSRERKALLRQLAAAQGVTMAAARQKQDTIDERIDQGGPSGPVGGSEPDTTTPPPSADPTPDETKPTEPEPKPEPKPKPQPKPDPPPADPPPASGSKVDQAIAFARGQLGEPYKWGGAGPGSWDCSGLVMKAWGAAGVSLPHSAGAQYSRTQKVSIGSIRRGDLVYWGKSAGSIYHMAMYLGGGKMIHAPRPGRSVEIVPITYWIKPSLASRPG
ncbi:MAG: NlpC/P60 family protein [Aeromicrobium sp.]